jgi:hypothetical protein
METKSSRKEIVKALIRDARVSWERDRRDEGQKLSEGEYASRMREFYSFAKEQVLTKWEGVGSQKVYFEALQEYAREDWIGSGFDPAKFDAKLNQQNRIDRKAALYGVALGILSCVGWTILNTFIPTLGIFTIWLVPLIVWVGWKVGRRLFARREDDPEIIRLIDRQEGYLKGSGMKQNELQTRRTPSRKPSVEEVKQIFEAVKNLPEEKAAEEIKRIWRDNSRK